MVVHWPSFFWLRWLWGSLILGVVGVRGGGGVEVR